MPGPLSSNVSRSPRRPPSARSPTRPAPPPPGIRVFLASSLAAVTTLVWSTRLNPISTAHWRVTCRTRTTSSSAWIPIASSRFGGTEPSGLRQALANEGHALLRVQRGADPDQIQPELHERDRDRGPHADHDGLRVQDAGHVGDVPQGAADERVDDLESRDVDE